MISIENLEKSLDVKAMIVFRKAFRKLDSYVSESFKESQLTPTQFAVLDVLYSKGTMKIGALIDSMLATSGNMTVVINNMEQKGLVRRHQCPSDKRSYLVELTELGRSVIERALPLHIDKIEQAFTLLTDEEKQQLVVILKKFKNLD